MQTAEVIPIEKLCSAGNYQILPVSKLKFFWIRDKRQEIVDQLINRLKTGYNPARPLSVVMNKEEYLVVDGNHRLDSLIILNVEKVPCFVYPEGTDPYFLAINCNQDEDTYAPLDLFDWLGIIGQLRDQDLTQAQIGEKVGWSRSAVLNYILLLNKIDTQVLDLTRQHQIGRVSKNDTTVSFDFSEGWFRTSGLYDLQPKYQLQCMESFIDDKCKWSKEKVQKETAKYKLWQVFIIITESELVNQDDLPDVIAMIENNTFKTEAQLRLKINDLNQKAKNKLICGDCLVELEKLEDCSLDLVVTDPPYGINYNSNRSQFNDHVTKEGITNDANLDETLKMFDDVCKILNCKTKPDAHIYVFTSWKVYPVFVNILSKYFEIKNLIIWDKENHGSGDLNGAWGNRYELIIFATKGKKALNKRRDDIIGIPRLSSSKMICPTQKPVELIEEILLVSAQKADVVCDPFMGSGSVIKAVKNYGDLSYVGIEIDREIFEKAKIFIGDCSNV